MNLWILTIGSSDVQLDSDQVSRKKERNTSNYSNKVWRYWYEDIKPDCYDIGFEPKPAFDDVEEPYRIPPRVLGMVYESSSEQVQQEIRNYLTFPLLNNFVETLKNLGSPDVIVVLLTDQSAIFQDRSQRRKPKSRYWQDTCKLEPILESYLKQHFSNVQVMPLILLPQEEPGLDDWDRVLNLVREQLNTIPLETQPDTVYVSHQAGTPALSSAVQFESLAKFRTNVQFLVSNEQTQQARTISRSTYLEAMQRQEAKALLERHDYAGVKLLLGDSLNPETQILLEAAIQWNLAEFQEFVNQIQKLSDQEFIDQVNQRYQHYWWTAYETAYLAVIRHQQKNIVEALFHSFRAVEGLVCQWAETQYKPYIYYEKGSPQMIEKIQEILPEYWEKMKDKNSGWLKQLTEENKNRQAKGKELKPVSVGLFSQNLYLLLEIVKPDCKKDPFLKKGLYGAKDERNQQFHRLLGLGEDKLFKAWESDNLKAWKETLIGCLNAIAIDDLPEEKFIEIEQVSLMAQVHQRLLQTL